jgi:hypothetical protein
MITFLPTQQAYQDIELLSVPQTLKLGFVVGLFAML